jgi:hypothetical protein
MSIKFKALLALGLLTVVTACAQQEEEVIFVEPAPIMEEPKMDKM